MSRTFTSLKWSRARISSNALSSVGIQPVAIARAVALATGTMATTTEMRNRRNPRLSPADRGGPRSAEVETGAAGALSVGSSTLALGRGPGFTSAHGLAGADEHCRG